MRKRGDPTWSVARDDAQEQKKRHGGEPYRLSPFGDFSPPEARRNCVTPPKSKTPGGTGGFGSDQMSILP